MQILVMAGLFLVGWMMTKAGFISVLFIVALIVYGLLAADLVKDMLWAKAISGFLEPVMIALGIVTLLAFFYNIIAPDQGEKLINWHQSMTIHAYKVLDVVSPPWWLYFILLAIATCFDFRREGGNAVSTLSTGKKYFGKTLAVITLLAGVTFFGQAGIIRENYYPVRDRLYARYIKPKRAKDTAIKKFVAERAVAQALKTITTRQEGTLQRCFFELGKQQVGKLYEDHMTAFYATKELQSHTLDLPAASPEIVLTRPSEVDMDYPDPEWLAAKIPSEEAASLKAIALEASSRQGLEKMTKVAFGQGADAASKLTFAYVDRLVGAYAEHFASVMPAVLDDLVAPVTKAFVSQYVDRAVALASSKIEWKGVPTGTTDAVATQIASDHIELASKYLSDAEKRSKEILVEVHQTDSIGRLEDLEYEANQLSEEARQAGGILQVHLNSVDIAGLAAQQAALSAATLASERVAEKAAQQAAEEAAREAAAASEKKIAEAAASAAAVRSLEKSLAHIHK